MRAPDPFKRIHDRANAVVLRHLSNASARWMGGEEFGVIFDIEEGDPLFSGALVTAQRCTVSLQVDRCPGINEGSGGLVIDEVPFVVASAVVPDSSGWATFGVMKEQL